MKFQFIPCIVYSGKILYKVELNSTPLCVDEKEGYLALGTLDGRVLFVKAATGKVIMQFQAHRSKVCYLFLLAAVTTHG
jgi:hypothetical protein